MIFAFSAVAFRRIADETMLKEEIEAWEEQRNESRTTIDWRFSVTDAREKLKRLYPSYSS